MSGPSLGLEQWFAGFEARAKQAENKDSMKNPPKNPPKSNPESLEKCASIDVNFSGHVREATGQSRMCLLS